jgi:SagB-type dehydrogenase family enzyme
MDNNETHFDKFWEASSLDQYNLLQFSQQLTNYDSNEKNLLLEFPCSPIPLPKVKSQLNKISRKRKSVRTFSNKELTHKELGQIFSSFYAWGGLEHRAYPSAGATYVTEVFAITFNVADYSGKVLYYDSEQHGIVIVSQEAPNWKTTRSTLNIDVEGTPNMLIIFVAFPSRAIAKYGERGGRFALLEVGAALQQLSLQIADSSSLSGVAVGGMPDTVWKKHLKINETDARIVLGYLVGK